MSTLAERIAQFENMAAADPTNDMAHFSLGSAYLQDGRAAEAAKSLEQCIELNPDMSKAYQLAGEAMIQAGWTDKAVSILENGYEVAASKGDLLPKNAMAELLKSIGREVPQLSDDVQQQADELAASGSFVCKRTGRPGTQLAEPPFRGPIGAWILRTGPVRRVLGKVFSSGRKVQTAKLSGFLLLYTLAGMRRLRRLTLRLGDALTAGLETGASVAVNGVCLTVTAVDGGDVRFDVIRETLELSNLGGVRAGARVNVEVRPAARAAGG